MADMRLSAPASGCEPLIFAYDGRDLRTLDRDGDPWFVANDVIRELDLSNKSEALRCLDDDERGSEILTTFGGPQRVTLISEPGFYKLVGRSRKPAAKRFDRWVRHEVLPTIRKTGSYAAPSPLDDRFERLLTITEKLVDALTTKPKPAPTTKKPKKDPWTKTVLEWAAEQTEPFRLIEMFPAIAKEHGMSTEARALVPRLNQLIELIVDTPATTPAGMIAKIQAIREDTLVHLCEDVVAPSAIFDQVEQFLGAL